MSVQFRILPQRTGVWGVMWLHPLSNCPQKGRWHVGTRGFPHILTWDSETEPEKQSAPLFSLSALARRAAVAVDSSANRTQYPRFIYTSFISKLLIMWPEHGIAALTPKSPFVFFLGHESELSNFLGRFVSQVPRKRNDTKMLCDQWTSSLQGECFEISGTGSTGTAVQAVVRDLRCRLALRGRENARAVRQFTGLPQQMSTAARTGKRTYTSNNRWKKMGRQRPSIRENRRNVRDCSLAE